MREETMSAPDNQNHAQPAAVDAVPAGAVAADVKASSEAPTERPSAAPTLPEGEMSFAEMFELAEKQAKERKKQQKVAARAAAGTGSGSDRGDLFPGQVLSGRVVGFSHDSVLLDVGAKAEGVVSKAELLDETGNLTLKEGDKVEVRLLSIDGDTIKLGKVLPHQSAKNREALRQAYDIGMPVEGRVTGVNKGGLDVVVHGLRAFCPTSQIDVRMGVDPTTLINQKLSFKILEFKDNGRNLVVSRRAILSEEAKKNAAEALAKIEEGQVLSGTVTSVKEYGAFVDLGGVEGLVHVSEVSHGRVLKPSDVLKPGDSVSVKILKIEEKKDGTGKKISLTIKGLEEDPWQKAMATLKEGDKVSGKVARIQPFGAFVEIMPGVDGLIHVSNISLERVRDPRQVLKEGDEVEATVITTDWSKRRIGLSLVKSKKELANELGAGTVHDGVVDRIETFGLFVKLPSGARGLVPSAETGTQRGADLKKEFNPGQKVKVTVLESDSGSGKIRLSIRAAAEAEERAEYQQYMGKPNKSSSGAGFGTFADLFNRAKK
jgi:small subunit ribosomal protein S1